MSTTIPPPRSISDHGKKEANDDGALKPTFGHEKGQKQLPFVYLEPFLDWNTFRDDEDDGKKKKSFESASTRDSFLVDAGGYHARSGFASSSSSTNEPSLFFRSVTLAGTFYLKICLPRKERRRKASSSASIIQSFKRPRSATRNPY